MNLKMAQTVLMQLASKGVSTICLCPGGRNAPFVEMLSRQNNFEVISFYDERSAGFYALGRSRKEDRPVAVLTTSGTAVSELLSSVIEAHYSQTPIVIVSADRPKRLRGTGAPQAIDQTKIFEGHVESVFDIDSNEGFALEWGGREPIHINLCFDEPLLPSEIADRFQFEISRQPKQSIQSSSQDSFALEKPLVVVGALSKSQQASVIESLKSFDGPLFLEALSGLRQVPELQEKTIKSGDRLVSKVLKSGLVKSVLRVGDVPVGRYWRDLDQLKIPTYCLTDKNFAGMESAKLIYHDLSKPWAIDLESWDWSELKHQDVKLVEQQKSFFDQFPMSEVGFFEGFNDVLSENDILYVGNSLPVRHWDLVGRSSNETVASRGVNGIDGQISTALGWAQEGKDLWIVLGDLTTLYDFSGLWLSRYLKEKNLKVRLVVINNQGGQIFNRIFDNPLYINQHNYNFEGMALAWGWDYQQVNSVSEIDLNKNLSLIEFRPHVEQNTMFWERYDQLWQK